ncbi:MAG: hypothetical protein AMXMBFR49_07640 [Chlorobiota bacterium]
MNIMIRHFFSNDQNQLAGSVNLQESTIDSILRVRSAESGEEYEVGYIHFRKLLVKDFSMPHIKAQINYDLEAIYDRDREFIFNLDGIYFRERVAHTELNHGKYLSFIISTIFSAMDGASSMDLDALTYDLSTGEKLKLDRIIDSKSFDKLSKNIISTVRKKYSSFTWGDGSPVFETKNQTGYSFKEFDQWLKGLKIDNDICFTINQDSLNFYFYTNQLICCGRSMLKVQIPFTELKKYATKDSPINFFNNLHSTWGKIKSSFGPLWFDATKSALEEYVQKENSSFYTVAQLPDYARSELESYFPGRDFSAVKIYKSVPLNSLKTQIGVINMITDLLGGVKPAAQTFGNNIYFEDFEPGRLVDRRTLMHELVHVIQYSKLGYDRFKKQYVESVAAGLSYYEIPLELEASMRISK